MSNWTRLNCRMIHSIKPFKGTSTHITSNLHFILLVFTNRCKTCQYVAANRVPVFNPGVQIVQVKQLLLRMVTAQLIADLFLSEEIGRKQS